VNTDQKVLDALRLTGVHHSYGKVQALCGVDLVLHPGELVCLLGPSGCGKTTVLRIAAGLEPLQRGEVSIADRLVAGDGVDMPPETRRVGLVFQDYALFPHLTVAGNVAFGLRGLNAATRTARVAETLEQVGMSGYDDSYPHQLSGGQQQRVALARALAPKPKVMLLDEPFSGLDSQLRNQVRDQTLHLLKANNTATLMVTHDPEEAMFMADRVILMEEGRVAQKGPPAELYLKPASAFVASFFGEVNRLAGVVQGGQVATPLGDLDARGIENGRAVEVLIRPEAMTLAPGSSEGILARVLAARMLGRSSLIHLSVEEGSAEELHLHARIPGRFLPTEQEIFGLILDHEQVFVFPKN
jgi:iron(III) transport system ATP-binding protein